MVSSHITAVNEHTFFCFRSFEDKNGKHGDGVQQGELKENTKEEEKSED